MKISIICPVLINATTKPDDWSWLKRCVHSIKKNSTEEHEIIVATNNGTAKEVPIDGIKVIHTEKQGQCIAVNMAVKEAKYDYILIIDEDMIFPTNWEELIDKAKETDFTSAVLMERGDKGSAHSFIVNDCGGIQDFDELKFEMDSLRLREERWENGFGFPLLCHKKVWELVEGYDENYDPWGSNCDSDLEYKLVLAGIMPRRWRGVNFYHFAQVSGTFAPEQDEYWRRNRGYFERKWGIARVGQPEIWYCDFVINSNKLRYRPSWMKDTYVKPVPIKQNMRLDHVGWITARKDLFEKFWCDILGFKNVCESEITAEMAERLFGVPAPMKCLRYEREGIVIEIHTLDMEPRRQDFIEYGINHICLWVDDRNDFLRAYDFDVRSYDNPKGHKNIFIRDLEGNWIELKQKL